MENLFIKAENGTFFTPQVDFNASGECMISGESYLEDTFNFYARLREWVSEYFNQGNENLVMSFKMKYFNTSSSRALLELMNLLKEYNKKGKSVSIKWYYPEPDDDEMLMEGEDFEADSKLEFEYIQYTP